MQSVDDDGGDENLDDDDDSIRVVDDDQPVGRPKAALENEFQSAKMTRQQDF